MRQASNDAELGLAHSVSRRSVLRTALAWGVFFAYLGVVEAWIGWARLVSPWGALEPAQVGIAVALFMVSYAVRAYRFHDHLRDATRGRWLLVLRLVVLHNALNNLMPMRSGELSFPLLARRYFDLGFGRSVPTLVWFRLLDLHTVLLVATTVGIGGLGSWSLAALVALPLSVVPVTAFAARHALRLRLRRTGRRRWAGLILDALDALPQDWPHFVRSWVLTWANWMLKLLVLAWVLAQFVDLRPAAALLGAIGGELTSVLPVHAPGGVGTYEAGIIAGFAPFEISMKTAIEAAINAHLFVIGAALTCAAVALLVPRRSRGRSGE